MPGPGHKIKGDPNSDRIVHMKETFIKYLREYVLSEAPKSIFIK